MAITVCLALVGCERPTPAVTIVTVGPPPPTPLVTAAGENRPAATSPLPTYVGTPTPDPTRPPTDIADGNYLSHTVAYGETLTTIAQLYGSSVEELMQINGLESADFLYAGQSLLVPGGQTAVGPSFKIIPDSELVYGPAAQSFDLAAVANGGYLSQHQEEVEGQMLAGLQVVQLVADRFSVSPRLLLAALEYRAGWLTQPAANHLPYVMGYIKTGYEGLYQQLAWAADKLNGGYYGRAEGGLRLVQIDDGTRVNFAPDINDGTAGVQNWLAHHTGATYQGWLEETGQAGFFATFSRLFGNPFAYTVEPLWPAGLTQPPLRLPWAAGETWYFTGGPHGGWASGSAWAALDFVPLNEQLGCYDSDAWVIAAGPGLVTRSGFGAVVVDLDGDGYAGTGWAVTYMHLAARDRVAAGTVVNAGDPLGHPSCEGGFSNGTHVHLSRTYNGRWVAADGPIPFVLSGWVSQGLGREYDGLLVHGEEVKEACECREEGNAITGD
ncbi:MAG: LysM peptidoglycan-binding domain-containing M23 family metallopeptidase [Chloroflexota bacterium]